MVLQNFSNNCYLSLTVSSVQMFLSLMSFSNSRKWYLCQRWLETKRSSSWHPLCPLPGCLCLFCGRCLPILSSNLLLLYLTLHGLPNFPKCIELHYLVFYWSPRNDLLAFIGAGKIFFCPKRCPPWPPVPLTSLTWRYCKVHPRESKEILSHSIGGASPYTTTNWP